MGLKQKYENNLKRLEEIVEASWKVDHRQGKAFYYAFIADINEDLLEDAMVLSSELRRHDVSAFEFSRKVDELDGFFCVIDPEYLINKNALIQLGADADDVLSIYDSPSFHGEKTEHTALFTLLTDIKQEKASQKGAWEPDGGFGLR